MNTKAIHTIEHIQYVKPDGGCLKCKCDYLEERVKELELERDGLKSLIADARDRFNEVADGCGRLLDQIKSHQQRT